MSNQPIQIGVIGTGGMGGRHIHNLATQVANANVVTIMDLDEHRLSKLKSEYGIAKTFIDAHALISDAEVQAVVIASPDKTHAQFTLACLEANKPVLCEKPLAANAEDAKGVFQTEVAKGQRLIQVGFMREYDPAHQKVKNVLQTNEIGSPFCSEGCTTT
jgi:myo-inositol 2-dehydrogenase/D-chiro-inositol 1-dehydrogenase